MVHHLNKFPSSSNKHLYFLKLFRKLKVICSLETLYSNSKYFCLFFKVGLDIQQAYTAFYLTPKTVGSKAVTNQKLKAESSLDMYYGSPQSLPAAKVDTGKRSDHII